MRRFFLFISALILIVSMAFGVSAAASAPQVNYYATVTTDSQCQVNMTVTVHLSEPNEGLTFPVPDDASSITVNGRRASVSKKDGKRLISLKKIVGKSTGDITFTVSYTLPDTVNTGELGTLELQLPMLSGFAYPIENFTFSVSLPTALDALPGFVSGYHQAGIEEYLDYRVEGNTISGSSLAPLKDHETLSMKLAVPEELFPQGLSAIHNWSGCVTAMLVCGGLALLYWLLMLRFLPLRRVRCAELPEGYTAGDLGSILHLKGTDVTMSVLTWAELGYVMLETDRNGRVRLHKRMDMGNERKEAEQKLFRALFARRTAVDATSSHYAKLCLDALKKPKGLSELVLRRSGNPLVFRVMAAGIGLFGGVALAIILGKGALLQGLLILLLGILGAVSGYGILTWGRCLQVHDPARLTGCFALCGIWLLLSVLAGAFVLGLGMVGGLLLAGWLFAWSGRRSQQGKLLAAQVSGLRRHLSYPSPDLLRQLCSQDPDYFFTMAPCAIALGKGKLFARRFGKQRFESCPYLTGIRPGSCTAGEWMQVLQKCVRTMNGRSEKRWLETLSQFFQNVFLLFKR